MERRPSAAGACHLAFIMFTGCMRDEHDVDGFTIALTSTFERLNERAVYASLTKLYLYVIRMVYCLIH